MTPVLKYPGAKWRIAEWIISLFPPHSDYKVYCEPFAGSAAVFFNKRPSHIETLNDLDGDVANFFRQVKDNGVELARQVDLTPYSREEYDAAYAPAEEISDLERARRFVVRTYMSYGGSAIHKNGFRTGIAPTAPNPARVWQIVPENLVAAHERLKPAQIENIPAEVIIFKYNNPETLLYVDPPYIGGTRINKRYYKHEMLKDCEHESLLNALQDSKSKIILSGYDSEMYNDILRGWVKFSTPTTCEQGLPRQEVIWLNYDVGFLPFLGGGV